jgi:hypothetical protein
LEVNLDKTKVVKFSRGEYNQGAKQESFDFLGFTFYIAKSLKGKATVKIKTACKTLRAKLKAMAKWYRDSIDISIASRIYGESSTPNCVVISNTMECPTMPKVSRLISMPQGGFFSNG